MRRLDVIFVVGEDESVCFSHRVVVLFPITLLSRLTSQGYHIFVASLPLRLSDKCVITVLGLYWVDLQLRTSVRINYTRRIFVCSALSPALDAVRYSSISQVSAYSHSGRLLGPLLW